MNFIYDFSQFRGHVGPPEWHVDPPLCENVCISLRISTFVTNVSWLDGLRDWCLQRSYFWLWKLDIKGSIYLGMLSFFILEAKLILLYLLRQACNIVVKIILLFCLCISVLYVCIRIIWESWRQVDSKIFGCVDP